MTTITTTHGETYKGTVVHNGKDLLVLADATGRIEIPKAWIKSRKS